MAYTSFFRDTDALNAISDIVIPAISHSRTIRVWDAGCASGEEPFTIAILFAAKLGAFHFRNLDVLATDYEESNYAQFADRIRAAEERGAAMTLDAAAEYALMLTAPGQPARATPPGLAKLSARERELVTLVARGRTEIRRVYHLDRGYENIDKKLIALGASIKREKE